MQGYQYQWKRFWVRRDGLLNLGDDGYLVDPAGPHKHFNPDVLPFEAFAAIPCLALLGEPGVGKTCALREEYEKLLQQSLHEPLWVDLRSYATDERLRRDIFDSRHFLAWINSNYTLEVFLDSLDECLVHVHTVAALLANELKKYPVSRLKLRIACRTAEWPDFLERELRSIWGAENLAALELAPLRRIDVEEAAQTNEVKPEEFLSAVRSQDAVALAVTPVTLDFLLRTFKKEGRLPQTRRELYERGCLILAGDLSASRSASKAMGTLTPKECLALAERIAAATIFSKRPSIFTGQDSTQSAPEDLLLSELAEGNEFVQGRSIPVVEANLREVLQRGLFSGRGPQRQGWSHWTYAEFLAAQYLIRRNFTNEQIRDLLFHPGSESPGKVVPQLQETAAWVASMNSGIMMQILRSDPQVLLRSTITNTDPSTRASLTVELLRLFDSEEIIDTGISHRYDVLCHPELLSQLRPYIQDSTKNIVVRRVAIDIAEACKLTDLLPDLLRIALDRGEEHHIRSQASHAVALVGDTESRRALRPLLDSGPDEDPDDQLRGHALRALRDQLSAEELFSRITLPRQENFIGSYQAFLLYDLIPRLPSSALPVALSWVANLPEQVPAHVFRDLAKEILKAGWEHLDDPGVFDAYVNAIAAHLRYLEPAISVKYSHGADSLKRHRILSRLLERDLGEHDRYLALRLKRYHLLLAEDFLWLIEELRRVLGNPSKEAAWASLAAEVFDREDSNHLELAFAAMSQSEMLKESLGIFFNPVDLSSPLAQRLREFHREQMGRNQKKEILEPPVEHRVADWLTKFESGDLDAWWKLNVDLTLTPHSTSYSFHDELQTDLTELPGWQVIDERTRSRCIEAAEHYLLNADPQTESWINTNTFFRPAAAGYRALHLLLKGKPERLSSLPTSAWSTWASILLAFPLLPGRESTRDNHDLVARAYAHAPEAVLQALESLISKQDKEHGSLFVLYKLEQAWNESLAHSLLNYARTHHELNPESLKGLLTAVLPYTGDEGLQFAVGILAHADEGEREGLRAVQAALALLEAVPQQGWPHIHAMITAYPDLGKNIFRKFSYQPSSDRKSSSEQLGEDYAADLYIWLAQHFPEDDSSPSGLQFLSEEDTVTWLRRDLLAYLRDKGTRASVTAIRKIAASFPEQRWLRYTAITAERMRLQETWNGVAPSALLRMAQERGVRFVESGRQLLEVVIDSLRFLETKLQGTPPAVRDLWNHAPRKPHDESHLSHYIQRHLHDDLQGRAIVANREVEIRPGEETDLLVTAVTSTTLDKISIVIEVKGCWNTGSATDMEKQLKSRYLKDNPSPYGLYVVGWFLCEDWDKGDYRYRDTPKLSLEEARARFEQQAQQLSDGAAEVRAFVLNAAWR